jgi:hypothetical protein
MDTGFLYAGQSVGGMNDLPTVSELIERTITEAEERLEVVRGTVRKP